MKNDLKDLQLVLDARVRLIVIESWDELRVLETLTSLAVQRGMNLRVWSIEVLTEVMLKEKTLSDNGQASIH